MLKELYLPETIDAMPNVGLCSNLEVLSIPGVKSVDSATAQNYALRCYALKALIIGESLSVKGQVFHCDNAGYTAQMTIYSTAEDECAVSFDKSMNGNLERNNMWNGKVVYCSETLSIENTWRFTADGKGIEIYGE